MQEKKNPSTSMGDIHISRDVFGYVLLFFDKEDWLQLLLVNKYFSGLDPAYKRRSEATYPGLKLLTHDKDSFDFSKFWKSSKAAKKSYEICAIVPFSSWPNIDYLWKQREDPRYKDVLADEEALRQYNDTILFDKYSGFYKCWLPVTEITQDEWGDLQTKAQIFKPQIQSVKKLENGAERIPNPACAYPNPGAGCG